MNEQQVTAAEHQLVVGVRKLRRAIEARNRLGSGGTPADALAATKEIEGWRDFVRGRLEALGVSL